MASIYHLTLEHVHIKALLSDLGNGISTTCESDMAYY